MLVTEDQHAATPSLDATAARPAKQPRTGNDPRAQELAALADKKAAIAKQLAELRTKLAARAVESGAP